MGKEKIVVAMSGGIDSSTAAYLLREAGYEVIGVTMKLYEAAEGEQQACGSVPCCRPEDFQDARETAAALGIRHYLVNYKEDFQERVVQPFIDNYIKGLTPSPCILCNSLIKFSKLLHFAECVGASKIATGHYAINRYDDITSRHLLFKGKDQQKDQSYFLFELEQGQLQRTLFPLGGLTKKEVRHIAAKAALPVAEKAESQEICFIPNGNYSQFLDQVLANGERGTQPQAGEIVRRDGTVLGRHEGIHRFTIGQRHGLGIASSHPLYVIGIDPYQNQVIVGAKEELFARRFWTTHCNWISIPSLDETIEVEVKIRSRFPQATATVRPTRDLGCCAEVTFAEPQPAITPGQAAVFYWENVVVGGGWIYKVDRDFI